MKMYPELNKINNWATLPFGYDVDEEDDNILKPDTKALDGLYRAIQYREANAMSLRQAAQYVKDLTGRSISYETIRVIINERKHPVFSKEEA